MPEVSPTSEDDKKFSSPGIDSESRKSLVNLLPADGRPGDGRGYEQRLGAVTMRSVVIAGSALPSIESYCGVPVERCRETLTELALFLNQPSTLLIVTSQFLRGPYSVAFWETARISPTLVGVAYDPDEEDGVDLVLAGCSALVPHDVTPEQLAAIIDTLANGEIAVPARILSRALKHCLAQKSAVLTMREQEVFRLACSGLRNQAIAEQLFISRDTVRWHLRSIHAKLGRVQLRGTDKV